MSNYILWNLLNAHRGHSVAIAAYGDHDDPHTICLECEDCNGIILDAGIYTIAERTDF